MKRVGRGKPKSPPDPHQTRLPLLDLFSGIGGLSIALSSVCRTVAYCESSPPAQAVLQRNMAAGRLATAPVFDDVTKLRARDLPTPPVVITAGFPCQDASLASPFSAQGIQGERTGLVSHVFRLARELSGSLKIIFLENVPNFQYTGMDQVIASLHKLGFRVAYGIFAASSVGAAHQRRRWFCFAVKAGYEPHLRTHLSGEAVDWSERVPRFRPRTPATNIDMLVRCSLLGNAVVPTCAAHAYAMLSSELKHRATSPPATSPATSPPVTSPPATSPPATSPPATSPPATSPPAKGQAVCVKDTPTRPPKHVTIEIDCADGGAKCGTLVMHAWGTPLATRWRQRRTLASKWRLGELINQLYYDRASQRYLRRHMGYKGDTADTDLHFVINPTWVEHLMGYPTGWTAPGPHRV
jgi:DNA (cytosine-5)-methyltransferase 1